MTAPILIDSAKLIASFVKVQVMLGIGNVRRMMNSGIRSAEWYTPMLSLVQRLDVSGQ